MIQLCVQNRKALAYICFLQKKKKKVGVGGDRRVYIYQDTMFGGSMCVSVCMHACVYVCETA